MNPAERATLRVAPTIRSSTTLLSRQSYSLTLERDSEERSVEIPADLGRALKKNRGARETFEKLSYTNRKELVRSLESAKKPETRARRLQEAVTRLGVRY